MGTDQAILFIKYQDATLKIKFNLSKKVISLKQTIQKKISIKKEIQQLFFLDEKELDNDKTLNEYKINNNSTLILKCNQNNEVSSNSYSKDVTDNPDSIIEQEITDGKEEDKNSEIDKKKIIIKNKNEKLFFDCDEIDDQYKEKLSSYHQYIEITSSNQFLGEKSFLLRIDSTAIQFKEYLSENFYFPVKRIQIKLYNKKSNLIEIKNNELFSKYANEYIGFYGITDYVRINILPLKNKKELLEITYKENEENEYKEEKIKIDIFVSFEEFYEKITKKKFEEMYKGEFLTYKGKIIQNTKELINDYKFNKIIIEKKYFFSSYFHSIEIFVKTLTGKTISIFTDSGEIVGMLKIKVRERDGIPMESQRMVFKGMQLEDHRLLMDYNIQNGDTIHLVLRLRGG